MAQWTSAVGAAQLARLLSSQQDRPAGPGDAQPPAYRALADGIRLLVLEGRVPVAARLPAERELALALSVSRTTVAAAYEALRAEGFLESRRGAGSWTAVPAGNPLPARGLEPLPPESLGSMIDLGCAALPAPEPWLTRAVQGALEELPPYAHTHGDYPAGLPALRADARRPLHRARHPDHARADHGHHRRDGRHRRHLPPLRGPRRADRRRVALVRQHPPADAGGGRPAGAGRDGRGARRLGHGPLAPGAAGRGAPARLRRRRLPQPDRRARRRGPAAGPGRRRPLGRHRPGRRRDDDRAAAGRRRRACRARSAPSTRRAARCITVGSASKAFWAGHADRLGAGGPGRDPQPGLRPRLRRPGHARAGAARRQLADAARAAGSRRSRSAGTRPGRTATRWSRRCAGSCRTGSSRCRAAG